MIRIGTASWTDPTLLASGRFYPANIRTPAERLRHYASQFPMVEVNASYYSLLAPMQVYNWTRQTPADFRFHIKAFRLFTGHPTPVSALPKDIQRATLTRETDRIFYNQLSPDLQDELWRRFAESVEPMRMAGRLDALHFQFPPWIRPGGQGLRLAEEAVARMTDHPIAVEWRHASWLSGRQLKETLAWQRDHAVIHTIVDAPQVENAAPAVWEFTHPEMALVRLHGRNGDAWEAKTTASSGRFNYEYSERELAELAARIKAIAERIERTHVVLNTNYQDQGMRNAAGLRSAIGALL